MSFCHFSHLKAIYPYLKMIKKNAIYQFGNYPASKKKKIHCSLSNVISKC